MSLRFFPALLLALAPLHAAEKKKAEKDEPPPPPAHLLFVNAAEDRGLAFLVLDGQDVQRRGYGNGQATGWLGVAAGPHHVQVEHQPLGIVDKEADLAPGSHHAVIAHNHSQPQPETRRPPRPTVGVFWLDCDAARDGGKNPVEGKVPLVVVNATSQPEVNLMAGTLRLKARRLEALRARVPVKGSFLGLTMADASKNPDSGQEDDSSIPLAIASINVEEAAVFYVILYEKQPGEVGSTTFSLAMPAE